MSSVVEVLLTPDPVPWEAGGSLLSSHILGLFPGKPRPGPAHLGFLAPQPVLSLPSPSRLLGRQETSLPSSLPSSGLTPSALVPHYSRSQPCESEVRPDSRRSPTATLRIRSNRLPPLHTGQATGRPPSCHTSLTRRPQRRLVAPSGTSSPPSI